MQKFIFNKDKNVDWTNTQNEPFPLSTASDSFHQEYKIEGTKVVNYRIVDCPVCKKAQKIDNKLLLGHNILEIRCPWCLETMLYDASFIVGAQYHVENIEE